jgi:hypothetical protein
MPTAARTPQSDPLRDMTPTARTDDRLETRPADPDDGLGARENQVTPVAPAEGRPSPEDIAREAYLIYMANGAQHGRHDDDWYEAERRLSSAASRQSGSTPQQVAAQLDEVDTKDRTPG